VGLPPKPSFLGIYSGIRTLPWIYPFRTPIDIYLCCRDEEVNSPDQMDSICVAELNG